MATDLSPPDRLPFSLEPTGAVQQDVCKWTQEWEGPWHTSCENAFELTAGTPSENSFNFCCHCGRPLKEASA